MTIRHLAQRFGLQTVDLLAARAERQRRTRTGSSAATTRSDQADKDFQPIHNTLQGQVQATGYPTTYNDPHRRGDLLRPDDGLRLDRAVRRPAATSRAWAGCSTPRTTRSTAPRRRARRRSTSCTCSAFSASPGNFLDLRRSPTSGSTSPAATSSCRRRSPTTLGRQTSSSAGRCRRSSANADGTRLDVVLDAGQDADRHGRPRDPRAAVRGPADARLLGRGLRHAEEDGDHAARRRQATRSCSCSSRAGTGTRGLGQSNGNLYTDIGLQNTWDVTRGADRRRPGIIVDYSGGNVAGALTPSTPYSNVGDEPAGDDVREGDARRSSRRLPGHHAAVDREGDAVDAVPRSAPQLSYSYWKPGQYVGFSGYEGVPQGNIHFAGEHCSQDFQGYMEGGASRGRPRGGRDARRAEVVSADADPRRRGRRRRCGGCHRRRAGGASSRQMVLADLDAARAQAVAAAAGRRRAFSAVGTRRVRQRARSPSSRARAVPT